MLCGQLIIGRERMYFCTNSKLFIATTCLMKKYFDLCKTLGQLFQAWKLYLQAFNAIFVKIIFLYSPSDIIIVIEEELLCEFTVLRLQRASCLQSKMQPTLVLLPNLEIHKIVPPRHCVKAVVLEAKTQFGRLSKFFKKKTSANFLLKQCSFSSSAN